eukprot:SAG31_NODE_1821_length_7194_cov_11.104863_2_plen_89_part_00
MSTYDAGGCPLPSGGLLTPRRFLQLGMGLGMSSGMDELHWLLESAFRHDGAGLSSAFIRQVDYKTGSTFENNPIFSILHESIVSCRCA